MKTYSWRVLMSVVVAALALTALPTACDEEDHDSGKPEDEQRVWLDSETNLMWQAAQSCGKSYGNARAYCATLDWGGRTDWRLPTISELRTLVRGCPESEADGNCGITDECLSLDCPTQECGICESGAGPNHGCYGPQELPDECGRFWSASALTGSEVTACGLFFDVAYVAIGLGRYEEHCARCVR